jgi:hypothetical protein
MPIVLHQGYYDNFSPDMNNIKYSKQYVSNIMKSNSRLTNTNEYLNLLRSNTFNQPIDAKSLQDLVNNVKSIYKNNIELMIKLKNNFSTVIGGMPPVPPLGLIPAPPGAPGALIIPPGGFGGPPALPSPASSTSSHGMTPYSTPRPAAAPAAPSMMSSLGSLVGLMSGSGKKGGRVKIIEQYGVGTKITTIIDTIQNNIDNVKIDMMKLLSYKQYISPTNIKDIVKLHEQFFNYFNENIVPYLPAHVIPPLTTLIGVDFGEIVDKLNELYVNYYNEFNRFIIPQLTNSR